MWPAESKRGFDSLHPLQSSQSPIKSRVCCMLAARKKGKLLTPNANMFARCSLVFEGVQNAVQRRAGTWIEDLGSASRGSAWASR